MVDLVFYCTGFILYFISGAVILFFILKETVNYLWRRLIDFYSFAELSKAWRIYKRKKSIIKNAYKKHSKPTLEIDSNYDNEGGKI